MELNNNNNGYIKVATFGLLLTLILLCAGCGPNYHAVRIAHNGGDAPPFVEKAPNQAIDLTKVGAGDALALVQGNVERLLKSNEVQVHLLEEEREGGSESGSSKSQRKAEENREEKSKSQRKAEDDKDDKSKSQRKAEDKQDQRSKSQRKADDDQDRGKQGSKQAENEPSKSESKKPRPQFYFQKYVRLGNQELSRHQKKLGYAVGVKHHEDPDSVIFSLSLGNYGDADFQGKLSIIDRLPEGLMFQSTRAIIDRRGNSVKTALAFIPILGLYTTLFLPDYSDATMATSQAGFSDQSKGDLIHYEMTNLKLEEGQQVVFDVVVKISRWQ